MIRLLLITFLTLPYILNAQVMRTDSTNAPINASQSMVLNNQNKGISLGAYAQIDYNQQFGDTIIRNGKMDVHRMVLVMGYTFSKRTSFVTEVELEHVSEIYVEQAFINHNFHPALNLRAGLVLIPFGIVNEYHEPTTYNGVERPGLDTRLVPTTWREIGAGLTGRIDALSMRYQVYAVNGFLSYDDAGLLRGSDGLRKGRQKGAESVFNTPNLSTKIDYYGLPGLKIGLAAYAGKTQSTEPTPHKQENEDGIELIDSTRIGVMMTAADLRYQYKALTARAQFVYGNLSNTEAYNLKTDADLGSEMMGYYIEAGYNILSWFPRSTQQLVAFVRYEDYDTHYKTDKVTPMNLSFARQEIIAGIGWHMAPGAVLKVDYQRVTNKMQGSLTNQFFNCGIGIWF